MPRFDDELRARLLRAGVERRTLERTLAEIREHRADLERDLGEDGDDPDERLGDVEELAGALVAAFRDRTFAGRHPVVAFLVLGPVVSAVGLPLLAGLYFLALGLVATWIPGLEDVGLFRRLVLVGQGPLYVAAPFFAASVTRFALARTGGLPWGAVAGLGTSLLALGLRCHQAIEEGSVSIGISSSLAGAARPDLVAGSLAALACGTVLLAELARRAPAMSPGRA